MRKLILIAILANCYFLNAQTFETNYTRGYKSTNCGAETLNFSFYNDVLSKTDNYYNSTEKIPSRRESSEFDDKGNYYELWSPKFYLEDYGIDAYQRVKTLNYKLLFDRKGGNLLYIFEFDVQSGINTGKFYFTNKGYEIYCK